MPGRSGQAGVAVELSGEAFETLGAVVVLEEEREAGVGFGPDAVAVGADDLTPLPGAAPFGPPLVEPTAGRVRADPSREQKNPFRPTRCARRWLAARSWTRLRRQERSPRSSPASAATRAAPSGPRTQWNGDGLPHARGRKRSRMSRAYSSDRRIRARRSPLKPTSATCAVVSTRWSSSRRHRARSRSVIRPTTPSSRASRSRQPRRPGTDPSEPDGTVLDLDRAVVAGPDGVAPIDALCPDAVRPGPWPDIFDRLTTTYPLSPPTRRSPLRAPDVPVRAVARAPSEDGALHGALRGALDGAHCGHRGGHRPKHPER